MRAHTTVSILLQPAVERKQGQWQEDGMKSSRCRRTSLICKKMRKRVYSLTMRRGLLGKNLTPNSTMTGRLISAMPRCEAGATVSKMKTIKRKCANKHTNTQKHTHIHTRAHACNGVLTCLLFDWLISEPLDGVCAREVEPKVICLTKWSKPEMCTAISGQSNTMRTTAPSPGVGHKLFMQHAARNTKHSHTKHRTHVLFGKSAHEIFTSGALWQLKLVLVIVKVVDVKLNALCCFLLASPLR